MHRRHRPETTPLYAIVRDHLGGFERYAEERYAAPLPRYVLRSFRAYLRCGLLEHGFLRVRCESCCKERLVAFSCKQRGPCPSCAARVMCNTAAHLTDRVLPNVAIRQWVLSLPFELRIAAARDPRLVAACDRILFEATSRWMRDRLAMPDGRAGAVTFVQRFGGSLNLHVHFHVMVLDGLFTRTNKDAPPVFVPAPSPTTIDLINVLARIRIAVEKWIAAHAGEAAPRQSDALAGCARVATQRGLFAEIDSSALPGEDDATHGTGKKSASLDGFNLHAAVRIGPDDDVARERLVRYCARPAFALERIAVLPDGRIAYAIKTPRRGATHRVLTPVEFLARLSALLPPPRHPFMRYHGVLAPASKWRIDVVPRAQPATTVCQSKSNTKDNDVEHSHDEAKNDDEAPNDSRGPLKGEARPTRPKSETRLASGQTALRSGEQESATVITDSHHRRLLGGRLLATSPRLDWAKLLQRTFGEDVLVCPHCQGRTRIIQAVTNPPVVRKILAHLHEPPARAPPSGTREPLFGDDDGWPQLSPDD